MSLNNDMTRCTSIKCHLKDGCIRFTEKGLRDGVYSFADLMEPGRTKGEDCQYFIPEGE